MNALALQATIHCLTGCAIGEVLGMVLGSVFGWSNGVTIVASTALAFVSGYSLTLRPLLQGGVAFARALRLAFAADTVSIVVMEVVDNLVMLVVPGAMNAPLSSGRFWGSLALSLVLAGVAAFPVNRWLLARGAGHAVIPHDHRHEHTSGGAK
jgi:Domain of unknown function (DUF4396)